MTSNERVIASEAKQTAKFKDELLLNLCSLLRFARNDSLVWFKFRTSLLDEFLLVGLIKSVQYLSNPRHPFSHCVT